MVRYEYPTGLIELLVDAINDASLGIEAGYYRGEVETDDGLAELATRVRAFPVALFHIVEVANTDSDTTGRVVEDEVTLEVKVASSNMRGAVDQHLEAMTAANIIRAVISGRELIVMNTSRSYPVIDTITEEVNEPGLVVCSFEITYRINYALDEILNGGLGIILDNYIIGETIDGDDFILDDGAGNPIIVKSA